MIPTDLTDHLSLNRGGDTVVGTFASQGEDLVFEYQSRQKQVMTAPLPNVRQ